MSIDLPPPMPPVLADTEQLVALYQQKSQPFISGTVGEFKVEVIGFPHLRGEQIRRLMAASETPSEFIRALNKSYHRNNNLLVQLLYRQIRDTVYVFVVQSQLKSVTGPKSITKYFRGLVGESDLSVAEFDRHRALAAVKAQRQGVDYGVSYQVSDDYSSVVMSLEPSPLPETDNNQFYVDMGNQGNRYVGRYFSSSGFAHTFDGGTSLKLDYMSALVDLGGADGGKRYDGAVLSANYPSTFGFNSVEAMYSSYRRDTTLQEVTSTTALPQDISSVCPFQQEALCEVSSQEPLTTTETQATVLDISGDTTSLMLGSEQIIVSNPHYRISMMQRLEWIDDNITAKGHGTLLEETYGVLGFGSKYTARNRRGDISNPSYLQLFVRAGISGDTGTLGTETGEGEIGIGNRTARFIVVQPELSMGINLGSRLRVGLDLSGQYSEGDQVPQMQQYVLGGISRISAFLPGVLVGDSGAYGRLSLSGLIGGRILKFTPSLFVEHGRSRFENVAGEAADVRAITDAGVRFTVAMNPGVELDLVAARSFQEKNLPEQMIEDFEVDFFARVRINM